jgi:TolB-like protein/tetratricopeptide (TPR) repeat protein
MADIFISYSKGSKAQTQQLADELRAKGFTVWYDTSLVPGESFRNVITSELAQARAAIVIWTADSVKSDWVCAEASRARARGILIPVRADDVRSHDIPLPFGSLHTELLSNRSAIEAALAKLGVIPKLAVTDETHAPPAMVGDDGRPALTLPDKPSIAVLPFQNMSGDPEQEYFADGMVEEVITGLSRIKWLLVTSRNSSFIYKNKPAAVREVADTLGVRYVLEGGVRKSGNRVRITAQLIDSETGANLWAEQYDRLLEDVFAMQDDITMCVIGAIEPSLRKAEVDRVKRQRPNNLNAYDLLLRSLPFAFTRMPKDGATAIPLLESALKLEPNYGAAHAFLSWCLHARFTRGEMHEEDRIAAIHHAHAAIAQGNDDATALAIAAFVIALEEHDQATALKLFDRALELSNSNIFALSCSAVVLALMGKSELAIDRAQRALRLSPFDNLNFRSNLALAVAYFHTQRYEGAVDAARGAIDANPGFSIPRAVLAAALVRLGRVEQARAAAQAVLECQSSFTIRRTALIIELEPAMFEPLADAWREAGLPE